MSWVLNLFAVGRAEGRTISNLMVVQKESDAQIRQRLARERERAERDYYHALEITFARSAYPIPAPPVKHK